MADVAIDFSSLESSVAVDSTAETPETQVDTEVEVPETQEGSEVKAGSAEEGKAEDKGAEKVAADKSPSAKLHEAIKKFRDIDPEGNKAVATELKNLVGRFDAMTKLFPGGVKEAQELHSFISAAGGKEGIVNLQNISKSIEETDALLYAGDGKLVDNIVEDLKSNGKLESLGKLTTPLLDKLLEVDPKGYTKAFAPHFVQGLESSGVRQALNAVIKAFDADDKEAMRQHLTGLATWYQDLLNKMKEYKQTPAADPEREAFLKEKNEFVSSKEKAFRDEVSDFVNKNDRTTVLEAMKPYFKYEFLKTLPLETKKDLHTDIMNEAWKICNSNEEVKAQVKHLMSAKDRSKEKVENFWRVKMKDASDEAAKKIITRRYPGYAKSPARGVSKTAATTSSKVTPNAAPIQIAGKPKWEDVDWNKDPKQTLWITHKAYLRNGKFVKW